MLGCQIKFRAAAYLAVIQLYTFPFGFSIDKSIFGICRLLKFLVYTARIFSRIRIMLGGEGGSTPEWMIQSEWILASSTSIHIGTQFHSFRYANSFFVSTNFFSISSIQAQCNATTESNLTQFDAVDVYIPMNLQTHLIRLSKYRMIDYSDELIILKMPIECNETSFISLNSGSREHFAIFILLLSICVRHIINACKVETIP